MLKDRLDFRYRVLKVASCAGAGGTEVIVCGGNRSHLSLFAVGFVFSGSGSRALPRQIVVDGLVQRARYFDDSVGNLAGPVGDALQARRIHGQYFFRSRHDGYRPACGSPEFRFATAARR